MKDLNEYIEDIPRLIASDLQGEITPDEKVRLEGWIRENEKNRGVYERLRARRERSRRREVVRELNKRAAWERVDKATGGRRLFPMVKVMKYAAGIVLPLLCVGVAFHFLGKKEKTIVAKVENVVEIKPGEMKAELELAGGERLLLGGNLQDSLTNENGVDILKDGQGISYQGEGAGKEELAYNTLKVPRGGEFKVKLQDGTVVYVNSASRLRYPVKFTGEERRVYLSGEAYFEVEKNEGMPFVVEMEEGEIRVLGTQFNARSYKEEKQQLTTLVAGKVLLTSKQGKSVELTPGDQGVMGEKGISKGKVDVYPYTAWKDGNFVFRKQRLEDIMNIVERWYDVKVVFVDDWCREVSFSGNVWRYDGFNKLMEMLEVTGSVKFNIKDNVIYITKK
ncbi:FecR family protein [Butyricimonas sp.]|uniref:FecR family protein n=1 Tax=Butyricimonas sp. TaxID=1969738 RepID=UPI0025B85A81|nr:FecR family protein [Butyricimonas sp.]